MKKYNKGQYGYRNHHKKVETGKVAFGAAMIIAQLIARYFVDNTAWKNILTVMAILSGERQGMRDVFPFSTT